MTIDRFEYENSKEAKEIEEKIAYAMRQGLTEEEARTLYDTSAEYIADQYFNFN